MQPKFCEKCGSALIPNAMFCENCGSKVSSITNSNAGMNQTMQQPMPQIPPQSQMNQPISPQIPPQGAYPPTYPQYGVSYANKPQGSGKEIVGILIGIVLLISVVLIIGFLSKGNSGENVNGEPGQSQRSEVETDSKHQLQDKNQEIQDTEDNFLGLGEAGTYEGLSVQINGISAPNPDELYDQPQEGMEFIVLNLEIKNVSNAVLESPRRNSFTLEIDGNNYGPDLSSVYLPETDKYGGNPIEPGEIQYFCPLFQVPIGATDYKLFYVPGFDGPQLTYQFHIASMAESGSAAQSNKSDTTADTDLMAEQCSTTDRPEAEDFIWFTDKADDWVYGILSVDSLLIESLEMTEGSWKGLEMIYDYDGTLLGTEYFTITFSGEPEEVTADIHWHHAVWSGGTKEELVNRADEKMIGEFFYGGYLLGEPGNQIDLLCYELDGKQYAEGIWTVQSGEEVRVALVRP